MVPLEHWHQGEALIHQVDRELKEEKWAWLMPGTSLPITLSNPHSS